MELLGCRRRANELRRLWKSNQATARVGRAVAVLLFALFLSAGGNYWLWKERAKAVSEAQTATAKVMALDAMQKEMTERLATLEAEKAGLIEAKEQAVKDAQAKATELAKLKDDVAGVEVENEPDGDASADERRRRTQGEGGRARRSRRPTRRRTRRRKRRRQEGKAKPRPRQKKAEVGAQEGQRLREPAADREL